MQLGISDPRKGFLDNLNLVLFFFVVYGIIYHQEKIYRIGIWLLSSTKNQS